MTIKNSKPTHGGNLTAAINKYTIPFEKWMDMSTGISPWGYPIAAISSQLWQQLPPPTERLVAAAKRYYGTNNQKLAITPGSQLAIRLIPQQLPAASVAIPELGYQEHRHSWQLANHKVLYYSSFEQLDEYIRTEQAQHAVVINPNNPTGERFSLHQLDSLLSNISGVLLIDEAFGDLKPECSALNLESPNTVTLKSIGKFFGLAGARVGFAFGSHQVVEDLNVLCDPWSISGPSIVMATLALEDDDWQQEQRDRINFETQRFQPYLRALATEFDLETTVNASLFHTLFGAKRNIDKLHQSLAMAGIWTRSYNFDDSAYWLRFSLPKDRLLFEERIKKLVY